MKTWKTLVVLVLVVCSLPLSEQFLALCRQPEKELGCGRDRESQR